LSTFDFDYTLFSVDVDLTDAVINQELLGDYKHHGQDQQETGKDAYRV